MAALRGWRGAARAARGAHRELQRGRSLDGRRRAGRWRAAAAQAACVDRTVCSRALQARTKAQSPPKRVLRRRGAPSRPAYRRASTMSAQSGAKPEARRRFSLSRWSERKLEAARTEVPRPGPVAVPPIAATPLPTAITSPPDLPPIESLTFDSDFAAFLQPGVNETLRRMALK